jgi:hypothetical protein
MALADANAAALQAVQDAPSKHLDDRMNTPSAGACRRSARTVASRKRQPPVRGR